MFGLNFGGGGDGSLVNFNLGGNGGGKVNSNQSIKVD